MQQKGKQNNKSVYLLSVFEPWSQSKIVNYSFNEHKNYAATTTKFSAGY